MLNKILGTLGGICHTSEEFHCVKLLSYNKKSLTNNVGFEVFTALLLRFAFSGK
jgi:hypothetical protein